MTDPLGGVTAYQYDASGNLTQQTDALGHVTIYTYDANSNKLSETKARTITNGLESLLTSYQYDAQNRVIKTTYADGSTTQIAYDRIGKQSVTTDQLGRQTSYQYDLMGRLTQPPTPIQRPKRQDSTPRVTGPQARIAPVALQPTRMIC